MVLTALFNCAKVIRPKELLGKQFVFYALDSFPDLFFLFPPDITFFHPTSIDFIEVAGDYKVVLDWYLYQGVEVFFLCYRKGQEDVKILDLGIYVREIGEVPVFVSLEEINELEKSLS